MKKSEEWRSEEEVGGWTLSQSDGNYAGCTLCWSHAFPLPAYETEHCDSTMTIQENASAHGSDGKLLPTVRFSASSWQILPRCGLCTFMIGGETARGRRYRTFTCLLINCHRDMLYLQNSIVLDVGFTMLLVHDS